MTDAFGKKQVLVPLLSLFTSAATLVCCALPALMVSLGMGAVLANLVIDVPQLIWLSRYKLWVFGAAAILLLAAGAMLWHARKLPCPADPAQARACQRLRTISYVIYGFSVAAFAAGGFFAFIAPRLMDSP